MATFATPSFPLYGSLRSWMWSSFQIRIFCVSGILQVVILKEFSKNILMVLHELRCPQEGCACRGWDLPALCSPSQLCPSSHTCNTFLQVLQVQAWLHESHLKRFCMERFSIPLLVSFPFHSSYFYFFPLHFCHFPSDPSRVFTAFPPARHFT